MQYIANQAQSQELNNEGSEGSSHKGGQGYLLGFPFSPMLSRKRPINWEGMRVNSLRIVRRERNQLACRGQYHIIAN